MYKTNKQPSKWITRKKFWMPIFETYKFPKTLSHGRNFTREPGTFSAFFTAGTWCKFSSGAVFLAPKNPCSGGSTCQLSGDLLDRSCCAALLKDTHWLSGCSVQSCWKPKALVVSGDIEIAFVLWYGPRDETKAGGQMKWCKPFKAPFVLIVKCCHTNQ